MNDKEHQLNISAAVLESVAAFDRLRNNCDPFIQGITDVFGILFGSSVLVFFRLDEGEVSKAKIPGKRFESLRISFFTDINDILLDTDELAKVELGSACFALNPTTGVFDDFICTSADKIMKKISTLSNLPACIKASYIQLQKIDESVTAKINRKAEGFIKGLMFLAGIHPNWHIFTGYASMVMTMGDGSTHNLNGYRVCILSGTAAHEAVGAGKHPDEITAIVQQTLIADYLLPCSLENPNPTDIYEMPGDPSGNNYSTMDPPPSSATIH